MFDSLDEQMKHDDAVASSRNERLVEYALISVAAVVVFGAVWLSVAMMG